MTESADGAPPSTPGAKMLYLIRRRPDVTHEELVAHWFANHMPNVIRTQEQQASSGRVHARRYHATLFKADRHGAHPWDGMAQLWFDRALPRPDVPHGTDPADSFQERAEPYVPWATTEYVVLDGGDRLPIEPLTLNPPFPTTRSGFHKVTFLVAARDGADTSALFAHWLGVHAANVADVMAAVGGFRYVISHSVDPGVERFAGMAELYFPDEAAWAEFQNTIRSDGMEEWADGRNTVVLRSNTEMIGIP
ncbi:MAG: EthD domain-containing protein [Acidimicrobiales bacterium]